MRKRIYPILLLCLIIQLTGCVDGKPSAGDNRPTRTTVSLPSPAEPVVHETYDVTNEYLKDPSKVIQLADQTASFWIKALDPTYGGFYSYVNYDGSIDSAKQYKIAFSQSRNAYAMARAYQLTGERKYLDAARNALDFVYAHAWDTVNGGWLQEMDRQGSPSPRALEGMDWNSVKWSFNQLNMMSGISAMVETTRNRLDEQWLERAYSMLTEKMWDARPGYEGYFDMTGINWSNPQGKNMGTVNDILISHQMSLALLNSDEKYKERLIQTADRLVKLAQTMDSRAFGMDEYYDLDWKATKSPKTTYSGNLLQPAWSLAMAYTIEPKPEYKAASQRLADQILGSNAYDYRYGGSFATLNAATGDSPDREKSWWTVAQCVINGLFCYYLDADGRYMKMADESMNFFMNHMYDRQYGDAVENVHADGAADLKSQKGSYWKDAYNTVQLFYYTYLYGSLMLHGQPVSLYYMIEAQDRDRSLTLQPISLGEGGLVIKSVTLDGRDYPQFDGAACVVRVPANTGGEFRVTFAPAS